MKKKIFINKRKNMSDCQNPEPTDTPPGPDAIAAVTAGLGLNPCDKHAEFSESVSASLTTGLSAEMGGSVGSNGCSAISLLATQYEIKHDSMTCLIQQAQRDVQNSSENRNSIEFNCDHCTNTSASFTQLIDSTLVTQTTFSSSLLEKIKQETSDAVDTFAKVINTNKTEFGSLGADSRTGVATTTKIADAKKSLTDSNTVETIINKMYNSNEVKINLRNFDGGGKAIVIDQEVKSKMVATQLINASMVALLDQFSTTDLKTTLDVDNEAKSKGLASLISSMMLAWIIPLAIVVLVLLLVGTKVIKLAGNSKYIQGLLVVAAIVCLVFGILAFTKSNTVTGCVCMGVMALCLGGFVYIRKAAPVGVPVKEEPVANFKDLPE
jgi:hypothetical protein